MNPKNQHQKIDIYFRSWSRKKFAAFASMKRIIKICTLLVTYTLLNREKPVNAQNDTIYVPQKVDLEEVEITGQRTPGIYSNIARLVTVVSNNEISSAPAQSLNDLLEYLPGVDLRQRGVLGVQADIGIRGGSFDQTLILINGIPYNDPQTGHHNLNLPFDLQSIDRIEILEGPGSRVYGANAFSGAVNIITKSGKEKSLGLSLKAGAHNYYSADISAQYSTKNLSNFISFSRTGTTGYISNTDFLCYTGYYKGILQTQFGNIEVQAGYLNKAFGANSFYSSAYPDQFEQVRSNFLGLNYSTGNIIKTNFYFSWRRHHDRFELFREDQYKYTNGFYIRGNDTAEYRPGVYAQSNYYPGHNYHLTDVLISGLNTIIPSKFGISSIGIEYHRDHIYSNVLGTLMNSPIQAPGEERGQFTRSDERDGYNIFAEHTKRIKSFYLSGGVLGSYYKTDGFNVFLGGEISKMFKSKNKLYFSVNQSLRLPTFTDLYYNGPTNIGNPDLKPEKAVTLEGGYKMNFNRMNFRISGFNRFGRDIIDWVKLPEDTKYTTRNYTRLNTYGVELNARLNTSDISPVNYLYIDYSYINTYKNSNEYISAYALDYLKHKVTARISNKLYKSLSLDWNFTLQHRNGTYTYMNTEQDYKTFFLANARIDWKPKFIEIYLEIENLLNTSYRDFGPVVQPGRWIFAGINYKLNFASAR